MSNFHFFVDLETLGQSLFAAPILNASYITVDWDRFTSDNPYTFEELLDYMQFVKLDLAFQVKELGYAVRRRDLEWWQDQGELGKQVLARSDEDITPDLWLYNMLNYIGDKKIQRWWTRANAFDPVFIQRAVEDSDELTMDYFNTKLPYWNVRDTRTYIDTRFNFQNKVNGFCPFDDEKEWKKVFELHNSRHDVAADVLRLQRIERIINL